MEHTGGMDMYTAQPKKLLIMNILDILRKYSDENHRLSQKDIADCLRSEYDMTADRKSIKRNLMDLVDFGYEIEYTETVRQTPNAKTGVPEENVILSDFYLVREFSDSELRLLIDSVLFSKHIPYSQCRELVEKLEGLSNQYFQSRVKHIRSMPEDAPTNKQLFYTIETLDDAMTRGKQVAFLYNAYGLDKKLHPRTEKDGKPRQVTASPYQIAAANGRYYLVCNYEGYDNVIHCRLDRITDIQLLDSPRKPVKQVRGLENGLDLPRHMAEHIYMFTGPSVPVTFRFQKYLAGEVIDWFGKGVTFSEETEDEATAQVTVNLQAMRRWALQYALHVRVLTPESLRDEVREDIQKAAENYNCWEEKL